MRTFSVFTIAALVATSALVLAAPANSAAVSEEIDYKTGLRKEYVPPEGTECAPGYDTYFENGTVVPATTKPLVITPQQPPTPPQPTYGTDNTYQRTPISNEQARNDGYPTDKGTPTTYGGQPPANTATLEKEFPLDTYEVEEGQQCVDGYSFAEEVPVDQECPEGTLDVETYKELVRQGVYSAAGDDEDKAYLGDAKRKNYAAKNGGSTTYGGENESANGGEGGAGDKTKEDKDDKQDDKQEDNNKEDNKDDKQEDNKEGNKDGKQEDNKDKTEDESKTGEEGSSTEQAASSAFRNGASSTVAVVAAMGAAIFVL